ncbi:hypothetical protein QCA50_019690 [Cerrena zonata]|uniref:Uncharacterized protein n=1 Tax=Cerrena zonata TaxID=2478898 RepID=A0AAW0FE89_9APHY
MLKTIYCARMSSNPEVTTSKRTQSDTSPVPSEERHPLCPPLRCDNKLTYPMIYGYCVAETWARQYGDMFYNTQNSTTSMGHVCTDLIRKTGHCGVSLFAVVPASHVYTHMVPTDDGGYVSVIPESCRNSQDYCRATVCGVGNNWDYKNAKKAFEPEHPEKLRRALYMPEGSEPQWFWLTTKRSVPQPWTRQPTSKVVVRKVVTQKGYRKLEPEPMFDLVDDPRDIRPPEPEANSIGDDWVIVENEGHSNPILSTSGASVADLDNVSNVSQEEQNENLGACLAMSTPIYRMPAEGDEELVPPSVQADRRVQKCAFGYCVTSTWLTDYVKYFGGDRTGIISPIEIVSIDIGAVSFPRRGRRATVPTDQVYTRIIPDEEKPGKFVSVVVPRVKAKYTYADVICVYSNLYYFMAIQALEPGHAELLKRMLKMKAEPQWYWCQMEDGMPICPQPWTPGPGGKIVKRRPHEIIDNQKYSDERDQEELE